MYVVIRLRGQAGLRKDIKDTFQMLRLARPMHCVLVPKNEVYRGMIRKVKDHVTWGEINDDILRLLIIKRARKKGDRRLNKAEAEVVFDKAKNDRKIDIMDVKPVFRLTPPSKGFKKSVKQHFPKGELGYRGEKINELLKRMI